MALSAILRKSGLPLCCFLLGLIFACILVHRAWNDALEEEKQAFHAEAELVGDDIDRRINGLTDAATNLAALINSTLRLDGDQFRIFSESLFVRYPFLVSTSYLPRIFMEERDFFEQQMREKGFPLFSINIRSGNGYAPSPLHPDYFPLLFYEPYAPANVALIGFDISSQLAFAGLIHQAVHENRIVFSSEQLGDGPTVFSVCKVIYAGKDVRQDIVERSNAASGLVLLQVDPDRLLANLKGGANFRLSLRIDSVTASLDPGPGHDEASKAEFIQKNILPLMSREFSHDLHGVQYRTTLTRAVGWRDLDYAMIVLAMSAGLIIVVVMTVAGFAFSRRARELRRRNEEIEHQVFEKTAELSVKNMQLKQHIEERLQIERALARSEDRFRELFDRMTSGVVVLQAIDEKGDDFVIVDFNRAAEEMDSIRKDELLGGSVREIFPHYIDSGILKVFQRVWETGLAEYQPVVALRKGVDTRWRENSVYKLPSGEIVALYNDITQRVRTEEQLRQAHKMEAIGTLAGGIAHDFNNILAAILGYSELAKATLRSDTHLGSSLDGIIKATHRAKDLVKQILTFSRMGQETKGDVLQPYLIIKESLKLLRASLPATIEIKEDIDSHCGCIMANPTQVQQVIVNLCTNALHAMENQRGTLQVSLYRKTLGKSDATPQFQVPGGEYIELMVADTGRGIDQEIMGRIFEPYFTTKEVGKGTGMGLAVVLGIVQNCQGMIRVESEPGKGTTFFVSFPRVKDVGRVEDKQEAGALTGGHERILLVDDEQSVLDTEKSVLEHLGYQVTAVLGSLDALGLFRSDPAGYDLVVTDQTMPDLTGGELAAEMLRIRPDMPIILCTGYSEMISREKALEIGIHEFIMKPFDRKTLAGIVRDVLDNVAL
ncbi:MAG: response regulator [Deltaproteobacteria bacterium]|nr:response regulator [Deltaproteobacteria bacterium]